MLEIETLEISQGGVCLDFEEVVQFAQKTDEPD